MTNEIKHTPGPWVKDKHGDIRGSNGKKVVTRGLSIPALLCGGDGLEEEEANARIMLAAPLLLEALRRIAEGPWPEGMETPEDQCKFDAYIARSAIAKAEFQYLPHS